MIGGELYPSDDFRGPVFVCFIGEFKMKGTELQGIHRFSESAQQMSGVELVEMLNEIYRLFDLITTDCKHTIKIETISEV
jgi:hypothetical protein